MRKAWMIVLAGTLVLAACGSNSGSDDTAAPGAANTTAGDHAHGGEGNASCTPTGTTVNVVASSISFQTDCLAAPANTPFTVVYENKDTIGHNIVFLESHTATQVMFRADIFGGPATKTFNVGPLKAGTYAFHCEVHPNIMMGTFVVK